MTRYDILIVGNCDDHLVLTCQYSFLAATAMMLWDGSLSTRMFSEDRHMAVCLHLLLELVYSYWLHLCPLCVSVVLALCLCLASVELMYFLAQN